VNAFWDIELDLNTPSPDPAAAAAMRHPSASARRGTATVGHRARQRRHVAETSISTDDMDKDIASALCASGRWNGLGALYLLVSGDVQYCNSRSESPRVEEIALDDDHEPGANDTGTVRETINS
jgi:hypothetical protein